MSHNFSFFSFSYYFIISLKTINWGMQLNWWHAYLAHQEPCVRVPGSHELGVSSMPVIPALVRKRYEHQKFKVILCCTEY